MVILDFLTLINIGQNYSYTLSENNFIYSSGRAQNKNGFLHDKAHYYKATKLYYRELLESRCECTSIFISCL